MSCSFAMSWGVPSWILNKNRPFWSLVWSPVSRHVCRRLATINISKLNLLFSRGKLKFVSISTKTEFFKYRIDPIFSLTDLLADWGALYLIDQNIFQVEVINNLLCISKYFLICPMLWHVTNKHWLSNVYPYISERLSDVKIIIKMFPNQHYFPIKK